MGIPGCYWKIALIAVLSRVLVLALGYVSSVVCERFDKSTELLQNDSPFRFLLSWDAFHFLDIINHGYAHEHALPFFPLLPYLIRQLPGSNCFTSAILFNNIVFILSSILFYKISIQTHSPPFAFLSTILFIFNPAAVVYSSLYSESLFAFIFLMAYYYFLRGKRLKGIAMLSLSGLCRSNAVLFVVFVKLVWFIPLLFFIAAFQFYSLLLIWKNTCNFKVFVPYSYIQNHYWEQGFLRFYTRLLNIGNAIYGLPFILYGLYLVVSYFGRKTATFINKVKKQVTAKEKDVTAKNIILFLLPAWNWRAFLSDPLLSEATTQQTKLVAVLGLQVLSLVLVIHWNIAARFISYNPILYWTYAQMLLKNSGSFCARLSAAFFFTYGILYVVFFSCFYPPA